MITDAEIKDFLSPHNIPVRKFFDGALAFANDTSNRLADEDCKCYKRSQATIINNYVIEKAKPYFKEQGVEIDDKYDSLVLKFDCSLISRFKKLSRYNLLSNHSSNSRNLAMIQGTLFDEYPPAVFVEIGYVMDRLGIGYEKIVVVKRVDKVAIELFEILPIEQAQPDTVITKAEEINPEEKHEETQIRKRRDTQG